MQTMEPITVYVPAPDARTPIDPGSGIVGSLLPDGTILADFEGNRNAAENLITFADRVGVAAGRHRQRYPTHARQTFTTSELIRVGTFDPETGDVTLSAERPTAESPTPAAVVAGWCALEEDQLDAELASTGARHKMRRDVMAALASRDPSVRRVGQHLAARYQLKVDRPGPAGAPTVDAPPER